jgi:DNA modification methylase
VKVLDQAEGNGWHIWNADCIEVARSLPDESVHMSVYSPPFASLYTYSASDRDMGNARTHDDFHEQYGFLLEQLFRVTKPGRVMSVHCMVLPTSKTRDGVIGLTDFPGRIIAAAESHGWIYHSKVTIRKDPVTAMQRTKALGLLHKQILKDSCMSRMGIPDEVVTFRKPGENPERVAHTRTEFPVTQWQEWAEPIWTIKDTDDDLNLLQQWSALCWPDINPSDTLQHMSAREEADERHICPLQLEVTRRCIRMWTNPGDTVLSPFMGIGSEGHVALEEGRRFIGAELKGSYYQQSVRNLQTARKQLSLLDLV